MTNAHNPEVIEVVISAENMEDQVNSESALLSRTILGIQPEDIEKFVEYFERGVVGVKLSLIHPRSREQIIQLIESEGNYQLTETKITSNQDNPLSLLVIQAVHKQAKDTEKVLREIIELGAQVSQVADRTIPGW